MSLLPNGTGAIGSGASAAPAARGTPAAAPQQGTAQAPAAAAKASPASSQAPAQPPAQPPAQQPAVQPAQLPAQHQEAGGSAASHPGTAAAPAQMPSSAAPAPARASSGVPGAAATGASGAPRTAGHTHSHSQLGPVSAASAVAPTGVQVLSAEQLSRLRTGGIPLGYPSHALGGLHLGLGMPVAAPGGPGALSGGGNPRFAAHAAAVHRGAAQPLHSLGPASSATWQKGAPLAGRPPELLTMPSLVRSGPTGTPAVARGGIAGPGDGGAPGVRPDAGLQPGLYQAAVAHTRGPTGTRAPSGGNAAAPSETKVETSEADAGVGSPKGGGLGGVPGVSGKVGKGRVRKAGGGGGGRGGKDGKRGGHQTEGNGTGEEGKSEGTPRGGSRSARERLGEWRCTKGELVWAKKGARASWFPAVVLRIGFTPYATRAPQGPFPFEAAEEGTARAAGTPGSAETRGGGGGAELASPPSERASGGNAATADVVGPEDRINAAADLVAAGRPNGDIPSAPQGSGTCGTSIGTGAMSSTSGSVSHQAAEDEGAALRDPRGAPGSTGGAPGTTGAGPSRGEQEREPWRASPPAPRERKQEMTRLLAQEMERAGDVGKLEKGEGAATAAKREVGRDRESAGLSMPQGVEDAQETKEKKEGAGEGGSASEGKERPRGEQEAEEGATAAGAKAEADGDANTAARPEREDALPLRPADPSAGAEKGPEAHAQGAEAATVPDTTSASRALVLALVAILGVRETAWVDSETSVSPYAFMFGARCTKGRKRLQQAELFEQALEEAKEYEASRKLPWDPSRDPVPNPRLRRRDAGGAPTADGNAQDSPNGGGPQRCAAGELLPPSPLKHISPAAKGGATPGREDGEGGAKPAARPRKEPKGEGRRPGKGRDADGTQSAATGHEGAAARGNTGGSPPGEGKGGRRSPPGARRDSTGKKRRRSGGSRDASGSAGAGAPAVAGTGAGAAAQGLNAVDANTETAEERRRRILRRMGLVPPRNSPFVWCTACTPE